MTLRPRFSLVAVLVGILLALFFARWLPHGSRAVLDNDSGIFLFIGQQIDNGLAPYAEVWDHKPPLVFWLNALALRITSGSPRGIVYLAGLFVFAAFLLLWFILRPRVGIYPSAIALLLALNLIPQLISTPNSTELFSLPLQALAFFLLARDVEGEHHAYTPVLQGLLAAALFQLRPNNAAAILLYVAVLSYDCLRRRELPRLIGHLGIFSFAFVLGNVVLLWPVIHGGHLREYWEAAFQFNAQYSARRPALMHVYAIGVGLGYLSAFGGSLIAGASAATVLWARPSWTKMHDRFALLALFLFVLEIAGSSVSGMAFEHYFILWLLPATVLAGIFFQRCSLAIGSASFAQASVCGACIILLAGSLFESVRGVGEAMTKYADSAASVLEYVQPRASASDRVYVWNSDAEFVFRLGRKPVSRFFHSASMVEKGAYRTQAKEALLNVEQMRPAFIIEDHLREIPPMFEGAAPSLEGSWDAGELRAIKNRLRSCYELAYTDSGGIKVYRLIPERRSSVDSLGQETAR
ncbi:MAG TPA: glycosyltransferase family 39 protein [Bryobacteraceae bacterium]|jgi:hypothetical protein